MSQQAPKRPVREFAISQGGAVITAAIWLHEKEKNGRVVQNHTVRLQKQYFDEDLQDWQTTAYLYPNDLLVASVVLEAAYCFIKMRERDPQASTALPPEPTEDVEASVEEVPATEA